MSFACTYTWYMTLFNSCLENKKIAVTMFIPCDIKNSTPISKIYFDDYFVG